MVERADATQYPALRSWMDANIVQSCCKMLQVFERYIEHILLFTLQIVEQLPQVTLIGVERIDRHITLQLQVAHIAFDDIFIHILCKVTDFFSYY